jgi:hypothetical protein
VKNKLIELCNHCDGLVSELTNTPSTSPDMELALRRSICRYLAYASQKVRVLASGMK